MFHLNKKIQLLLFVSLPWRAFSSLTSNFSSILPPTVKRETTGIADVVGRESSLFPFCFYACRSLAYRQSALWTSYPLSIRIFRKNLDCAENRNLDLWYQKK